eukprot:TRINITY_DN2064_c0_g6_i1.p1 TRINITY_DN2064_c0_g6~~TRINITY_DN2064_c0_g6_i1.p1  ORF type:complete len:158 (-),score=5.16 TRINITY_DN2064_c0_g6_i1:46-519(-)
MCIRDRYQRRVREPNGKFYRQLRNGYARVESDYEGRVVEVYADLKWYLPPADREKRSGYKQRRVGGGGRFHGGHLLAWVLCGLSDYWNLCPMYSRVNKQDYAKVEAEVLRHLKNGHRVTVHITVSYRGSSVVPEAFTYRYMVKELNIKESTRILNVA